MRRSRNTYGRRYGDPDARERVQASQRFLAAVDAASSCARPVHRELRLHQHERRRIGDRQGPGDDGDRSADRHHPLHPDDGRADDSRQQAQRHLRQAQVLPRRPGRLRRRGAGRDVRSGCGPARSWLLAAGRRRLGPDDPADLHPGHGLHDGHGFARQGARRHQRGSRHRGGDRPAGGWTDHQRFELEGIVPAPGACRRRDLCHDPPHPRRPAGGCAPGV